MQEVSYFPTILLPMSGTKWDSDTERKPTCLHIFRLKFDDAPTAEVIRCRKKKE